MSIVPLFSDRNVPIYFDAWIIIRNFADVFERINGKGIIFCACSLITTIHAPDFTLRNPRSCMVLVSLSLISMSPLSFLPGSPCLPLFFGFPTSSRVCLLFDVSISSHYLSTFWRPPPKSLHILLRPISVSCLTVMCLLFPENPF